MCLIPALQRSAMCVADLTVNELKNQYIDLPIYFLRHNRRYTSFTDEVIKGGNIFRNHRPELI